MGTIFESNNSDSNRKKMKVFKWAKLGKQGWRFGMNQKSSKSDQLWIVNSRYHKRCW